MKHVQQLQIQLINMCATQQECPKTFLTYLGAIHKRRPQNFANFWPPPPPLSAGVRIDPTSGRPRP